MINMTINHYAPYHSEATMQRAQENLDMLRRSNFGNPSVVPDEAVIHEMAAYTNIEVEI